MTAAPAVRVVSFKYGTKVMMTPHPLTEKQRTRAGLKAIIAASESRPGKSLEVRLAREMIAVVQGESRSLQEKERLHRLAMVNRSAPLSSVVMDLSTEPIFLGETYVDKLSQRSIDILPRYGRLTIEGSANTNRVPLDGSRERA